jgi:3-oxoacyl-[acyl-carrier protein] reductase
MLPIKDTVTIVTGSSSGIGAASVRMLAENGGHVVINYSKSAAAAEEVAGECRKRGVEVLVCQADVGSEEGQKRLVDETMAKFGRITGLVNNAGTTKFVDHSDLAGLSAQDFHDIYHLNVIAPFQMTRACEPHMRAGGRGSVVNISSVAGVMGMGSSIAYAASKGALNTMTLSLARVLGPEIRVNTVCPGFVIGEWLKQGMGEARYEATRENLAKNTALKKPGGTAEDMAETVLWFLYGARHTTGEFLLVDGGMHLGQAPLTKR